MLDAFRRSLNDSFGCTSRQVPRGSNDKSNGLVTGQHYDSDDDDDDETTSAKKVAQAIALREDELRKQQQQASDTASAMEATLATIERLKKEHRLANQATNRKRPLPAMGTIYFMFFTILLSCATYTYSLPVITPPAAAFLAPDSAAETASSMYGIALMTVIFVPFCNDVIDRQGDVGAVVQLLAASGVIGSCCFLLAFQLESITLLWIGTIVAGAGSQISLNGATAAMTAIFISVDPARAGMINAMYMGAMLTSQPVGALVASLFPLTSYDPRTRKTVVDTTVFTIHLMLAFVGWVMFLNVPRHLFRTRAYQGFAPSTARFSVRKTVVSTLRSVCEVLVSKNYRGVLVSSLAGGLSLGMVNGVTATLVYFAEDHLGMKGEDVERIYALLFSLGALGAAAVVVPSGFFIDRFGSLFFIYTGCLVLGAEFVAMLLLPPAKWMVLGYWASFFSFYSLYTTALWPYLLAKVFPNQLTVGRDIGIWNALGSPAVAAIVASQGSLLAAAGTTGREMLGNREQYLLAGYNNCWISAIAVFIAFPLIIHGTGLCCSVSRKPPKELV